MTFYERVQEMDRFIDELERRKEQNENGAISGKEYIKQVANVTWKLHESAVVALE